MSALDAILELKTRIGESIIGEERERPVLLLVDQRIGMFFGSVKMMKSVTAADAAALAASRTIAVKDRVGAIVFNDSGAAEIRPQRSRFHGHAIPAGGRDAVSHAR
jgi:uncharacterized protein (DUF58 family)